MLLYVFVIMISRVLVESSFSSFQMDLKLFSISFAPFAYTDNLPVLQDLCDALLGFDTSLSSISASLERPHHG